MERPEIALLGPSEDHLRAFFFLFTLNERAPFLFRLAPVPLNLCHLLGLLQHLEGALAQRVPFLQKSRLLPRSECLFNGLAFTEGLPQLGLSLHDFPGGCYEVCFWI